MKMKTVYSFEINDGDNIYIGGAYTSGEDVKVVLITKCNSLDGEQEIKLEDLEYCEEEIRCMLDTGHLRRCTGVVKKVE